jgi:CheY-like chemotaxis protein
LVLVDDEQAIAELFAAWLDRSFRVATFTRPREALDYLQREEAAVLVTDLAMPEMSGLELISRARRLQPNLRALLISGMVFTLDREQTAQALEQVDMVLCKPVHPQELEECCRRLAGGGKPDKSSPEGGA